VSNRQTGCAVHHTYGS